MMTHIVTKGLDAGVTVSVSSFKIVEEYPAIVDLLPFEHLGRPMTLERFDNGNWREYVVTLSPRPDGKAASARAALSVIGTRMERIGESTDPVTNTRKLTYWERDEWISTTRARRDKATTTESGI